MWVTCQYWSSNCHIFLSLPSEGFTGSSFSPHCVKRRFNLLLSVLYALLVIDEAKATQCEKPQAGTSLPLSVAAKPSTAGLFSPWLLMNAVLRRHCMRTNGGKSSKEKQLNNEASFRHQISESVSVNGPVDSHVGPSWGGSKTSLVSWFFLLLSLNTFTHTRWQEEAPEVDGGPCDSMREETKLSKTASFSQRVVSLKRTHWLRVKRQRHLVIEIMSQFK